MGQFGQTEHFCSFAIYWYLPPLWSYCNKLNRLVKERKLSYFDSSVPVHYVSYKGEFFTKMYLKESSLFFLIYTFLLKSQVNELEQLESGSAQNKALFGYLQNCHPPPKLQTALSPVIFNPQRATTTQINRLNALYMTTPVSNSQLKILIQGGQTCVKINL